MVVLVFVIDQSNTCSPQQLCPRVTQVDSTKVQDAVPEVTLSTKVVMSMACLGGSCAARCIPGQHIASKPLHDPH